jgi:pimeloyl-ACP methyl ester carboxylesterase
MGGMVGLIYSGSFPDKVSTLVVLDGVTVLPDTKRLPTHERITKWVGQLDNLHDRAPAAIAQLKKRLLRCGLTTSDCPANWPYNLRLMA